MTGTFVSEPITAVKGSFDLAGMAAGEPGLPQQFRWRKKEFRVAQILERWKDHGDCSHGSGERYVRKHGYRVRTEEGAIMRLYFLRSFGRGKVSSQRWWIQSVEEAAGSTAPGDRSVARTRDARESRK